MRRRFLKTLLTLPVTASIFSSYASQKTPTQNKTNQNLKISLNAFSFNAPLMDGTMNLDDLLEFSAHTGFDAVDITAYYFPGYPNVPPDEYLYHIKRKAFKLGLDISGTGVRNDFTDPDKNKRIEHIELVKKWIDAASKIGAPVLRIFAGTQNPSGYSKDQILEWMLMDINECLQYGKNHGVVVAIQNHNDFIQTAAEAICIIEKVNSEWFGLILDTGSYRVHDPYEEIAKTVRYAVNWQVKENVFIHGSEKETDMKKLMSIIKASDYRGYLPIETLGQGDPKIKVAKLYNAVKMALKES